jgi:type IV pilus assembly protein PilO
MMQLGEITLAGLMEELPLLKPVHRLMLVAGTWCVLLLGGFFLLWQDSMQRNTVLDGEIVRSLSKLQQQSLLIGEAQQVEAELGRLEAQLPVLKMALPTERELASLLARINEMILINDMKLAEFIPQPPVNQEVMRVVPVKINLRGEGAMVSQLPNHIASLSRQVSMKKFEMSLLPGTGDWQVAGELNAFAQLPVEEKRP